MGYPAPTETIFPQEAVDKLLQKAGIPKVDFWSPVRGGANNRVYFGVSGGNKMVLKIYFRDEGDKRDRLRGELCFHSLAQKAGGNSVSRLLEWDLEYRLGLFDFVEGRKLKPGQISADHVRAAARLVACVNDALNVTGQEEDHPVASEACFSLAEHLDVVNRRVERLCYFEPRDNLDDEAVGWIKEELAPLWHQIRERAFARAADESLDPVAPLSQAQRWVSPSDFGFHNALLDKAGDLKFFDFEYAGWDDPAKLIADFFCQPSVPVPINFWDVFVGELAQCHQWYQEVGRRGRLLLPVYRIKWCCIILNEFLAADARRRNFSRNTDQDGRAAQLCKARSALRKLLLEV